MRAALKQFLADSTVKSLGGRSVAAVAHPLIALVPLLMVAVINLILTYRIALAFPATIVTDLPGLEKPLTITVSTVKAVWAVEGALLAGILTVTVLAFARVRKTLTEQIKAAVTGALIAALNTASEYGFGGVIAALPGFAVIRASLQGISNPLVNEAVTVTALAGVTGSASGGLSIALAAMSEHFLRAAQSAGIPPGSCTALHPWPAGAWIHYRITAR
jgi:H+/gluconate symporter-like permease